MSGFPIPWQACGDFNGKLAIYDLERNDVAVWSADAHKSIINAVDGLGGPDSTYGAPELVGDSCLCRAVSWLDARLYVQYQGCY